jgi:hypothetical protein
VTLALIAGLVIVVGYLAKRASDATTENTALRDQVASLKRQLAKRR